jgi:3-phosphoshikimate 1-carboxyvinyltransferase
MLSKAFNTVLPVPSSMPAGQHAVAALTAPGGRAQWRSSGTPESRSKRSHNLHADAPKPLSSHRSGPLAGRVRVPGDKSISHRALMLGALASGTTRITGLLEAEDVINTAKAVTALGATANRAEGAWEVRGRGVGGLVAPAGDLDFGNSGTGSRLMMGVIAGNDIRVRMVGDASLSRRPMRRVLIPLRKMGLSVLEDRETLPLTLQGSASLVPIEYATPVPSAQVKSAILLAALAAVGETTVIEREATRDHTERMLRYFGANVGTEERNGATAITVTGQAELEGRNVAVPGDPSSAAFLLAAAAIVPGSDVTVEGILINHTRTGFYTTLIEMGADVTFENERDANGEPVADVRIRYRPLKGVRVPAGRAPSMIDEYPILSVVAAFADGETRMDGLAELKVKESDRLGATAAGLVANGVAATVDGDSLIVSGRRTVRGGGTVVTHMDHRIAMAFLVLGLATDRPVTVDDVTFVATSFPEFRGLMASLSAKFQVP